MLWHQQRRLRRDHRLIERLRATQPPPEVAPDPVLGGALAMLRQSDRELLLLIAWEGLGVDEAAQVLGCSPNACAVRLHRARKRLQAALVAADPTANAGLPATKEVVGD